MVWLSLSPLGGGRVAAEAYSKAACYEKSLKLHPTDAMVWWSLGTAGGGMVSGVAYGEAACYGESLNLRSRFPSVYPKTIYVA